MNVGDLGEFGLIERLRGILPPSGDERLIVGIGDDAAVWRSGDRYVIATTDTMVEGVHFLREHAAWQDVGWKALAVNVSDIAAMGGVSTFALVTLALPPDTPVDALDGVYEGLGACASLFSVTVAGGDIVRSGEFAITVALAGEARTGADGAPLLLRRSGGRAGDVVAVTGTLGGAAGGLRVLREHRPTSDAARALVERQVRPHARLHEANAAVDAGVRCGIDVSDGLVQDLGHVCEASGLDAEVWLDRLPVDPALREGFPDDAAMMAATGGEDYELLLAAPEEIIERLSGEFEIPLTVVGRLVDGASHTVRVLDADGLRVDVGAGGWDHFGGADG
jgi:thiamine-monophosphate kinase